MNNRTIIQDASGINTFYAKIYSLVGVGLGISAIVSALMLSMFQSVIVSVLMGSTWIFYVAIAAELILVFAASGMAVKNSPAPLPIWAPPWTIPGSRFCSPPPARTWSIWSSGPPTTEFWR